MMLKKLYILPFILFVLMVSCRDDEPKQPEPEPERPKDYSVSFRASINSYSRATEIAFEKGDAMSVFAVSPASGMELKASGNYANNVKYLNEGTLFVSEYDPVTISGDNKAGLAYYAIYPYSSSVSNKFSFTVKSDQTSHSDYTQSDLCTAFASQTTEKTVNLKFSHQLSSLLINFSGENLDAQHIEVALENVSTSCDVDINANTYSPKGSKGKVLMGKEPSNTFRAIIVPQTVPSDVVFITISLNGVDYPLSLSSDYEFKSGKQAVLEIEIEGDKPVVLNGYINPWDR